MVFVSDCGGKESVYGFFMRFKGVKCQSSINLLVHKFRLSLPLLAKHFSAIHLRPFLAPIQSNTITTPCSINLSRSPSQIFKQTCEKTQTLIIFSDFASQSQTPELPHHAPNSLAHIHRSIRPYFLYTPLPYDGDVRLARHLFCIPLWFADASTLCFMLSTMMFSSRGSNAISRWLWTITPLLTITARSMNSIIIVRGSRRQPSRNP